jgi:predicted hotdog family 3-hydroxylacyl-ACP dehydratase
MVDRLLTADEFRAVVEVDVPRDGLFVRDGAVPSWVGIEYMAQAVSAWSGARALRGGGRPRIGLLLGTRRYDARCPAFPGGRTLRVSVRCELMADNGLGLFDCSIHLDGDEVATGRLSVFEPADPPDAGHLTEPRRA